MSARHSTAVIEASPASGRDQLALMDVQVHWDDHDVTVILRGELGRLSHDH
jgi:hypothetical protein